MTIRDQLQPQYGPVSCTLDRFVGDDWLFRFSFGTSVSAYTWTASLITEPGGAYTVTQIGATGAVDDSNAASGYVYVTVADTITSGVAPDVESISLATDSPSTLTTRLALLGTRAADTTTFAIVPIRVIKR